VLAVSASLISIVICNLFQKAFLGNFSLTQGLVISMNAEHQSIITEVVNLFVVKDRQERFIELLSKPKRYDDGLDDLLRDPRHLDPQVITEIPRSKYTPELIYDSLKKAGFDKQCFAISTNWDFDGKTFLTLEILEKIGNTDTLLFCPISKAGYYEGHEGWRYILQAKK
jgi:hypothetical protein